MSTKTIRVKILDSSDAIDEGQVIAVEAGSRLLAVSKFAGKIGIIDSVCPHLGGPLAEGELAAGYIKCPWHGYQFHGCSGKAPPGIDSQVAAFEPQIIDDGVFIELVEEDQHQQTVADTMITTMVQCGVDTVFGMVGHSNLGLADAMRRHEEQGLLTFIGIRHEGAAAFAASAYGKLTGKPAACLTIAGPGATNLYTGLWDAKVDRAPLLALTGQVATQVVGTGNFQEVDLIAAFSAVADFNHRVQSDSPHQELMRLAIKHAIINRNVSHLTFPDEVQTITDSSSTGSDNSLRIPNLAVSPPAAELASAIDRIGQAKRVVIIVGYGARAASAAIINLAEKIGAAIMTTFKAKGQIGDHHPLACGVLGKSGTPVAAHFMSEADLLIVLGASFANHTGIATTIPTIQVDLDPLAIAKFHPIAVRLLGDIALTTALILDALADNDFNNNPQAEISEKWTKWRSEKHRRANEQSTEVVPAYLFEQLNRHAPKQAVMCVDVGNNAYSFGRYFETMQQRFLLSGYLGSIGFALPAAMGAWAATKGKQSIVAIAGDGGFGQYMAELTTLVQYNMSIKLIILNNNQLAKISKEQKLATFDVWKTALSNPSFADFANNCGMLGLKAENRQQLEAQMPRLFASEGPALLEVMTDPDKM